MIPDSVKAELEEIGILPLQENEAAKQSTGSITHCRFQAKCYSYLIAGKILQAMKDLDFESPELSKYDAFSWDTGKSETRYIVKCWYPYTMNYEDVEAMLKALVYKDKQ